MKVDIETVENIITDEHPIDILEEDEETQITRELEDSLTSVMVSNAPVRDEPTPPSKAAIRVKMIDDQTEKFLKGNDCFPKSCTVGGSLFYTVAYTTVGLFACKATDASVQSLATFYVTVPVFLITSSCVSMCLAPYAAKALMECYVHCTEPDDKVMQAPASMKP